MYLQTLIDYLKRTGHEIHILANRWSDEEGIIFHKINRSQFGSFLSTITFNQNTKKAIKDIAPDCAISFERTTCQDIYRAGEGCHIEWLKQRETIDPFWKRFTFRINPLHITLLNLERKIFRDTGLIIANSNMVKSQIVKHYGVPENRIRVIYNGVDLRRFSPQNRERWRDKVRKGLSIPEDAKVILFVGSGFERKGLKTLLRALSVFKMTGDSSLKNVYLLVIGKGNIKKFKSIAEGYGVKDGVYFLGIQRDIERFYGAADLFVLPTIYDPFSNATIEAMSSGLPVITTIYNGVSELIENNVEGFILKNVLDSDELSEKIRFTLLDSTIMGNSARQKAENFSIEDAARKFLEVINETTQHLTH
ncbi:MAG: glycosyltransferase family 4 protein [Nitrospirae bacterium]|nr:glycosyltransferase family 4 protein [Nitrospirota bacterium]